MKDTLSHVKDGQAHMVNVSAKDDTLRKARAIGFIALQNNTLQLIKDDTIKKGPVLTTASLAGIQAAKQCSQLIPLCHNLPLTGIDVTFRMADKGIEVLSEVTCTGPTGVEMEALTAVSVALLTIYDMCKAVDKTMVISDIRLVKKTKEKRESSC
ncbi:MAG: cyclic pyranopterin monophosphate synthase MoaC [Bacteroidales bacterium]|jgi:cyclic pyranopterin phosphate synthase